MEKTIHFCSGMPRAGSTLLMNILGQNPRFAVTPTSGLYGIVRAMKDHWETVSEFRAISEEESAQRKLDTLRGMIDGFFAKEPQPIVIDKSRGWLGDLEMVNALFDRKVKVLVPVRPLLDILSSFEKLYRKRKAIATVPQEIASPAMFSTVDSRCAQLCSSNDVVGNALTRVRDVVARGCGDQVYFVEFGRLTRTPKTVLNEIYEFLGEESFEHDFENVQQTTHENDRVHGWGDLHKIRTKVSPVKSDWNEVLGPGLKPQSLRVYQGDNIYWRQGGNA